MKFQGAIPPESWKFRVGRFLAKVKTFFLPEIQKFYKTSIVANNLKNISFYYVNPVASISQVAIPPGS